MNIEKNDTPELSPSAKKADFWAFLFWMVLVVAGFAYVAGVLCGRENPLADRQGGYWELAKLLMVAPFLYLAAPRHSLMPFAPPSRRALCWNLLGYALPFFIALHFFYLQGIPQINYSLTVEDFRRMHWIGRVVFGGGGLLIAALALWHVRLARREGILAAWLGSLAGAVAAIALATWLLRESHTIHVHHYFLFGFFVPWARFRDPVSLVCQGACMGVCVEGISEWSLLPIWDALR